jgi:hypothetical protein
MYLADVLLSPPVASHSCTFGVLLGVFCDPGPLQKKRDKLPQRNLSRFAQRQLSAMRMMMMMPVMRMMMMAPVGSARIVKCSGYEERQ